MAVVWDGLTAAGGSVGVLVGTAGGAGQEAIAGGTVLVLMVKYW